MIFESAQQINDHQQLHKLEISDFNPPANEFENFSTKNWPVISIFTKYLDHLLLDTCLFFYYSNTTIVCILNGE